MLKIKNRFHYIFEHIKNAKPVHFKRTIPLEAIAGIGAKTAEKMRRHDYNTIQQIAEAKVGNLTEIPRVGKKSATKYINGAQKALTAYKKLVIGEELWQEEQSEGGTSTGIEITIHAGGSTVGGTVISLMPIAEEQSTQRGILIEFGLDFGIENKFLDDFLSPRSHRMLLDEIFLGQLPRPEGKLKGIYREDYQSRFDPEFRALYGIPLKDSRKISHVLLSHAHADHIGSIRHLHGGIGLVSGLQTAGILMHLGEIYTQNSIYGDLLAYKWVINPWLYVKRDMFAIPSGHSVPNVPENKVPAYKLPGNEDFAVAFYETEHSIPGAGAFLIVHKPTNARSPIPEISGFTEGKRIGRALL